jgi:hypothetical protein
MSRHDMSCHDIIRPAEGSGQEASPELTTPARRSFRGGGKPDNATIHGYRLMVIAAFGLLQNCTAPMKICAEFAPVQGLFAPDQAPPMRSS